MSTISGHGNEENTRIGKIFLAEDGIVRVMQLPDVDLTMQDAQECFAAYLKIRQDKRRPILIDARKMKSFARGARQFLSGEEAASLVCAVAMILDTPSAGYWGTSTSASAIRTCRPGCLLPKMKRWNG